MSKAKGLSDKIAGLLTPAATTFDSEEDDDSSYVNAGLLRADNQQDDEIDEYSSLLRRQNVSLLSDVDPRYAAEVVSRESLRHSEDSSAESEDGSYEEDEDESEENGEDGDDEKYEEATDENDEDEVGESDHEDGDVDCNESLENTESTKLVSKANECIEVQKGLSIKNQLTIQDMLMKILIQSQKSLVASNKLPQTNTFLAMSKHSDEFKKKTTEAQEHYLNILDKLITLQKLLIKKYPGSKNLDKGIKSNDSDEEIPSDTEDESMMDEEQEDENDGKSVAKKRKLQDYESDISEQYKRYRDYGNKVIHEWDEKTTIVSMKSSERKIPVLKQIDYILSDKPKLIKRTQCNRSNYKIIGEKELDVKPLSETEEKKYAEAYNTNIFDDDDFYLHLLRQLIEVKSADLNDEVQLTRQRTHIQNIRKKMKRKLDTKATKGRKLRYAVHRKLVNFMARFENSEMPDKARDEIFASIFGKKSS